MGVQTGLPPRAPFDAALPPGPARMREVIRLAAYAPNSHNTQPWRFAIGPSSVTIHPDFTRRLPVVDPDDHHLWVSLGCAVEGLAIAASGYGLRSDIVQRADHIDVNLSSGVGAADPLLDWLIQRGCARTDYDGRSLRPAERDALLSEAEATVARLHLIEDADRRATLRDLTITASDAQLADPAFVAELRDWIRFDDRHVARTGDGLSAAAMGNPSMPPPLGRRILRFVLRAGPEAARLRRQMDSTPTLAVLVSATDDPPGWVATGRMLHRLTLRATSLGLRHAFLNQAVEQVGTRARLSALLHETTGRPSIVLRLGHGATMPFSVRRPVNDILLEHP